MLIDTRSQKYQRKNVRLGILSARIFSWGDRHKKWGAEYNRASEKKRGKKVSGEEGKLATLRKGSSFFNLFYDVIRYNGLIYNIPPHIAERGGERRVSVITVGGNKKWVI